MLSLTSGWSSPREKSIAVDKDDLIQVKEAFKWVMQDLVAKELGGVAVVTKVGGDLSRRQSGRGVGVGEVTNVCVMLPEFLRGGRGVQPPRDRGRLSLPVSCFEAQRENFIKQTPFLTLLFVPFAVRLCVLTASIPPRTNR